MPGLGIYVAAGLYAILGAVVCIGLQQFNVKDAMVVGIGAPAIITGFMSGQTTGQIVKGLEPHPPAQFLPAPGSPGALTDWFVGTAFAQPIPPQSPLPTTAQALPEQRQLKIRTKLTRNLPSIPFSLWASQSTKVEGVPGTQVAFERQAQLTPNTVMEQVLPFKLDLLAVGSPDGKFSNVLRLPPQEKLSVCVLIDLVAAGGFNFGGPRRTAKHHPHSPARQSGPLLPERSGGTCSHARSFGS
jgi:hypothetical protein